MSDDRDSNVVQLPSRGDGSGSMPEAPNIDGLFFTEPPEEPLAVPPESPEETTMELPPIPRPMDPEMALASEGISTAPEIDDGIGEASDGEYVQRRSLAERIGDWLEYRIAVGQARMEGEAPYEEAEIARKVQLLNAKTEREVGLLEQQNKLRQAQVQARTAREAAQGKGDVAGSKSSGKSGGGSSASGLGRDKGGRKPASPGSGGSGRGTGGGRGTGTNNSGGAGSRGKSDGSGGANSPKGPGKGPGGSSGGRNSAGKGNGSPSGSRGRQSSPGGSRGSGGSGKGGSTGNGGGKDRKQDPKRSRPTPELPRNRQERKGARQTARQQRRAADHAAALTDRSKDRDQTRGNKQADHEERRRKKTERAKAKADRAKAKRTQEETKKQQEEAKQQQEETKSSGRTTLGQALGEEAQRRWDKRRSHESAKPEDGAKPPTSGSAGPDGRAKSNRGPDGGTGGTPKDRKRRSRTRKNRPPRGEPTFGSTPTADGPGWPGNREETAEWVGREGRKPKRPAPDDEYIPDAEVITRSLPPAPEPHTERPGTSRPAEQETNVGSTKPPASKTGGLAAQHRTNVTFDEYLVDIANIALNAGSDKDEAKALATITGKIADLLREMATDLGNDHNIETTVIDLISDLADAATRMQHQAERCARDCEIAADAAGLAAVSVARTYREDLDAMDAGGVTHASAAAHH
ncbi:ATP/GTP-binding protein [Streptomyces sp. NPDC012486]|uniref:ATP/GTP-binding protein n=1 Tax=unclassified Streptomyces TaxID=2593676 RepID=UPI0033EB9EF9